MPRGDGTGPMGMGPMTGRAAGYCAGYAAPGFVNSMPGRGFSGWGAGGGGAAAYGAAPYAAPYGPVGPAYAYGPRVPFARRPRLGLGFGRGRAGAFGRARGRRR